MLVWGDMMSPIVKVPIYIIKFLGMVLKTTDTVAGFSKSLASTEKSLFDSIKPALISFLSNES